VFLEILARGLPQLRVRHQLVSGGRNDRGRGDAALQPMDIPPHAVAAQV
jgi:hypothetical protein